MTQSIRDQALEWLVRVQSDRATLEDWAALTAWLEASEQHRAAFEQAELLASELTDRASEIEQTLSPPLSVAAIRRTAVRRPAPWFAPAALAACIAAAVVVAPLVVSLSRGSTTTYRTGVGETRLVSLADGSRIRLDSASRLAVRLSWTERRADLAEGEASFDVAKDARRPFVVNVGDARVRVVGTEFNIRHYDGRMVITVRRGIVEVSPRSGSGRPVARLVAGQQLRHADGRPQWTQATVDPDAPFAWAEGRLICDRTPLPEVVAYLNHRFTVPIRLAGAAEGKTFSGVLQLNDEDAAVRDLASFLSLRVDRSTREIVLK